MLVTETTIKNAVAGIVPRTEGVQVGWEIRLGLDSTNDEAVWVWVMVPDARIEEFQEEWADLRDEIRQRIREQLGDPLAYVYIRMLAASEADPSP
jgi:hypothetical protein